MKDICDLGDKIFSMTPLELLENNICSPIRLFIKDEPHKDTKAADGKWRLISGVSVDDQIIDRMLYGLQNNKEILNWEKCCSKPGIGLDDEGMITMATKFKEMLWESGTIQSTDVSNWDWSVQGWELEADQECRRALAGCEIGKAWDFLSKVRTHCINRKVFCLPNGTLVAQKCDGIQASGWYNTSSTNSRMRVLVRIVALIIDAERRNVEFDPFLAMEIVAMGDDCVEAHLSDSCLKIMKELGHDIKSCSEYKELEDISFCSQQWTADGLAYPENPEKTLFRFFSHSPTSDQYPDWLLQLRRELRNHPDVERYVGIASAFVAKAKINGENTCSSQTGPETGLA
jgi:hypothetical protein